MQRRGQRRRARQARLIIEADTTRLSNAIEAVDTADNTQEARKSERVQSTGDRNADANRLYEAVLALQNAASLEFKASDPASTGTRAEFRLEVFPPSGGGSKPQPAPTPAPNPPTA